MAQIPKRSKLSDHLVIHLVRAVVSNRFKPGDSLPTESELANEFGMSKAVARESLQALASFGIARIRQGKRSIVLDRSEWNVLIPVIQEAYRLEGQSADLTRQLYEVRLILDSAAAGWATERATQQDIDTLNALSNRMESIATGSKDVQAFLEADRDFHHVIANATENIVLRAVLRNLQSSLLANWSHSKITAEELKTVAQQHAHIADAINKRDRAKAKQMMEVHLLWAQKIESERIDSFGAAGDSMNIRSPAKA